jgi:hypothetical protein
MRAYIIESSFQGLKHTLLDHESLIIELFNNVIMPLAVDLDNDTLDRRVALDQHAYTRSHQPIPRREK